MKARKHFDITPEQAAERLRDEFPPGSTARTILRNVSRSGMQRSIDVYSIKDGETHWLSPYVAVLLDETWDNDRDAIKVGGAGMDMGFHVVYSMSASLYGHAQDGRSRKMQPRYPLSERDKRRLARWRKKERSYPGANTSGGYAVNHKWI